MKNLGLSPQEFDPKEELMAFCKRVPPLKSKGEGKEDRKEESHLEIDFLSIEKEIQHLQLIQERTCEQIVEFVDVNRDSFVQISSHFDKIESKMQSTENTLRLVNHRIEEYKSNHFSTESRIQAFIDRYELNLVEEQVLSLAKEETALLAQFNLHFEKITGRDVFQLTLSQKHLISRFTYKSAHARALLSHEIVLGAVPDNLQVLDILVGLSDELEFYLGEQLAKVAGLYARKKEAPVGEDARERAVA